MSKIDNSTYNSIKKSRKYAEKAKSDGKYSKGKYGHSKAYKNLKIIMTLSLFLIILLDVVFSLIIFQTRKTLFVIIGCVMAIPFARNLIDLFMSLKANPLTNEEYKKTKILSEDTKRPLLYDITITETEGAVYIPCACVYNNNIIAYTPNEDNAKKREKIKEYISSVNTDDSNYRIMVTDKYSTFEKEIKKLRTVDENGAKQDEEIIYRLLSMGF